ncbi:methionine ABC transporter permease [Rossellomorea marisflavi]|uniref:Methionine ABC transporter permease n=1 Tax=Rossellomorea marisflavi TaxID=189381 RepID=A0A0J5VB76_9BACI|nr:methionine ABC transporter permease [Rossellomorea marisflavi]KMK92931.1 methionine ABC transporter permease [Rossellomorea marisflavi]KML05565.1 methionine ABC transporter permease [Rossellomorea marisflavi]KML32120.1 methionine ABC transporter permease [Rossellomorea marisflavi]KZE52575.1 methionine ABC transporter permease [Rossellomorea marisflavi]MCM2606401.1 ABC transporter permease [Rossellomorea marisflavi]
MLPEAIIDILPDLNQAFLETLYMVGISLLIAVVIGLPLGVLLFTTDKGLFLENRFVKSIVGFIVNMVRSIPFIILLVALLPLTKFLTGDVIGPTAASVSLSVAGIPFFARIVETALKEIDKGVIEASVSVGASPWMIIKDVLLPEAKPAVIQGVTITAISLIAYSAMAGTIGGGGVGDLAIRFGYYRYDNTVMFTTVVVLICLVQVIQYAGDIFAKAVDKR